MRFIKESRVLRYHMLFLIEAAFVIYGKSSLQEGNVHFFHLLQICVEYHYHPSFGKAGLFEKLFSQYF